MKIFKFFPSHSLYLLKFAIAPILTIFFGKVLFEHLVFDLPQLNSRLTGYLLSDHYSAPSALKFQEAKARLMWLSSALLYLFVNIGFTLFLWNIIKKTGLGRRRLLIISALLISAGELLYLLCIESSNSPIKSIFYFTFDILAASTLIGESYLLIIQFILDIINFVSILVPPFAVISGCCLISNDNTDLEQLAEQLMHLKELTKASSAFMIAGILHMQLWLSWPLSLLSDFSDIKELKELILSIIKYWSICYSLTIAALYLPISAHLRNQARMVCAARNTDDCKLKLPQWLNGNPFLLSPSTQIPQIITILGPMLAGSISPAITDIFSF